MGLFNRIKADRMPAAAPARVEPVVSRPFMRAMSSASGSFSGLDDPALLEFIRAGGGTMSAAGISVTTKSAMKNTTVMRCVSLISFSIGMLPLHLRFKGTKKKADQHALFKVLHRKPNPWQTAFEFRSLMEQRKLQHGDAFALIIRSGTRIIALVPLDNSKVRVTQNPDWSLSYEVTGGPQGSRTYAQRDVFHLRYGLSEDGFTGLSLVKMAGEAIGLALQAEVASARMFRNGTMVGGALSHPNKLSPEAYDRLMLSMAAREGAENAGKTMVLEEGMEWQPGTGSGRDNEGLGQRKHQIEEIARPFGVPRPLLGVDDTSWGSGIDVLGQMFVRYGLNPVFVSWEQAIERSLLTDAEADIYEAKYNAGALLRGSMKDQADFFKAALGSGGHHPWMHPEEVRELSDLTSRDDLPQALGVKQKEAGNEPA
jgi:HK97 family phage portal protein